MFWRKRNSENEIKYGSVNIRMLAALVDIFLFIIVWTPVERLLMFMIYKDSMNPQQELALLLQERLKQDSQDQGSVTLDFIASTLSEFFKSHSLFDLFFIQFLSIVFLLATILIFWIFKRSTPGKMLFSLKIVDDKTLHPASLNQLIIRLLSYAVSAVPFGLGIFFAAFNKKKRTWHDLIAGTAVIKVKRIKKGEK